MRISRLFPLVVLALALGGCLGREPQYVQYPAPQAAPPAGTASAYQVPVSTAGYQAATVQNYPQVAASAGPKPRGFFVINPGGPFARAPAATPAPAPAPAPATPAPAASTVPATAPAPVPAAAPASPRPVYSAPVRVASAADYAPYPQAQTMPEAPYLLDAGDRLRITVFGQEGLTNSYTVDAAGNVTLPLIGMLAARGMTTDQFASSVSERLKQGYIREPKVAIQIDAYRPFFIYGEVGAPGQYAYVANMTVENAIAIAGGFGPRADYGKVTLSRAAGGQTTQATVALNYPLRPGDVLRIGQRWF